MIVNGGESGRTNPDDVSTKNPYFFVTGPAMGSAKVLSMGSTYPNNYHTVGNLMINSAKRKSDSSFPIIGQIDFYPPCQDHLLLSPMGSQSESLSVL